MARQAGRGAAGPVDAPLTWPVAAWALALVVLCAAVYAPVAHAQFVALDDPQYVTENPALAHGLTAASLAWAFTTRYAANYHPLTWLSHLVDVQLFGLDAGWHHLTSLGLHTVNVVLLLLVLYRATGAVARSGFVAALFAAHPLHVESVAWVAERKDVLSTLFWLLALWSYVDYVRTADRRRYLLTAALFICGLLAKPMVVTLPLTLLLFDLWPLGRLATVGHDLRVTVSWAVVREKIPFFILSALSGVVTIAAQQAGGAVSSLNSVPIAGRLSNALITYVAYTRDMVWPAGLSVLYSLVPEPPIGQALLCLGALIAISWVALQLLGRAPYVAAGWFWYLVTLVPVIGLIQVGVQARADRYTYVPLIGLFIVVVWSVAGLAARLKVPAWVPAILGAVSVAGCAGVARTQVGYWQNTTELFARATSLTLHVDRPHALIEIGRVFHHQGRLPEAIDALTEATKADPSSPVAADELGTALADAHRYDEAVRAFRQALAIDPSLAEVHNNLGAALATRRDFGAAATEFAEAARLQPTFVAALVNEGLALEALGQIAAAKDTLGKALQLDPANSRARAALDRINRTGK
jgi:Flp pilus assembly protein TadD